MASKKVRKPDILKGSSRKIEDELKRKANTRTKCDFVESFLASMEEKKLLRKSGHWTGISGSERCQ